jgi:hypothetical protein
MIRNTTNSAGNAGDHHILCSCGKRGESFDEGGAQETKCSAGHRGGTGG